MLSNAHSSLIRRAVLRWRLAPSSHSAPWRNDDEQSDAIAIAMSDAALDPATTHDSPWHQEEKQGWEQTSSAPSVNQVAIKPSFAETTRQALMNSQLAKPEPQDSLHIHTGSTLFRSVGGGREGWELPVQLMGLRFRRTPTSLDAPIRKMRYTRTAKAITSKLPKIKKIASTSTAKLPKIKKTNRTSTTKPPKIQQDFADDNKSSGVKSASPSIRSILTPVIPGINIASFRKEKPTLRSHFTALRYLRKPTEPGTTIVGTMPPNKLVSAAKDLRNETMEQLNSWSLPAKATAFEKARLLNQIVGAGRGLIDNDISTRDLHMLSKHGTMEEMEKSSRLLELRRTYDMHAKSRFGIPPLAGDTEEKLDRMIDLWVYQLWLISEYQSSDAKQSSKQRRLMLETETNEKKYEVEVNDEETQAEVDSLLSLFLSDMVDEPLDRIGGAQRMNTRVMERLAKDETKADWKAHRRKKIQSSGGVGVKEDWKNAVAVSKDVDALYDQALPRASLEYEDHAPSYKTKSYSILHKPPSYEIALPVPRNRCSLRHNILVDQCDLPMTELKDAIMATL